MTRSPCILYLDAIPGNPIQKTTLAGIERYARSRGLLRLVHRPAVPGHPAPRAALARGAAVC